MSIDNINKDLPQERIQGIERALQSVTGKDRSFAVKKLQMIRTRLENGQPVDKALDAVEQRLLPLIERSRSKSEKEWQISYPDELPISDASDEILKLIESEDPEHQVIVIAGETGSGKTTQIPKMCLQAGRGVHGQIGCTQPRRIAARAVASRLAEELGTQVGEEVGYQVRFDDRSSKDGFIKVMTDGVLLAETQADAALQRYDTLIIDEAHERSLNIDFLLGYLQRLRERRSDLKIIITSATIDTERFALHFAYASKPAPIVEVSGRTYPVEVRYRPLEDPDEDSAMSLEEGIVNAVAELSRIDPMGDMLIFLPGERDIADAGKALAKANLRHTEVLPLLARLSSAEQQRIFHPGKARRIILATNIAETSLTVPRIKFVVDSGLARISRYSHRSKMQRLPIEPVSQASANQRAGRCGRLGPGICIRLFDEEDFSLRREFTEPEIVRTDLATVILQMKQLGLGDIEAFPFLDTPDRRLIKDGLQTLLEIQALDSRHQLTNLGRQIARVPLDVRLARILLAGSEFSVPYALRVIAAGLAIQDPRERPMDKQQAADQAHDQWQYAKSDFIGLLKLWAHWQQVRSDLGTNQQRKWCKENFLHFMRMREWTDLVRQLSEFQSPSQSATKPKRSDRDLDVGHEDGVKAIYEPVHRAVLTGFASQVGMRTDDGYLGARSRKFFLFPGSAVFGARPNWVVTAFIVETTKVYARTVGQIEARWIEEAARHLLKQRVFDPFWSSRQGRVMGYEQLTLYGIPLVMQRRIHYGPHDPEQSRELFILHALVRNESSMKYPFLEQNQALRADVAAEEDKRRRRDLSADEHHLAQLFSSLLPADIYTVKAFRKWFEALAKSKQSRFQFALDDVLQSADELPDAEDFPEQLKVGQGAYPLAYALAPGTKQDGVTLTVPLHLLNSLSDVEASWMVPGLLHEKVVALIKSLPKSQRRLFVPAPDVAKAFCDSNPDRSVSLEQALAEYLSARENVLLEPSIFRQAALPEHLRVRYAVEEDGEIVDASRDLVALQERHGEQARKAFLEFAGTDFLLDGLTNWTIDALPESVEMDSGATAYPAIVDQEDAVGVRLFEDQEMAASYHRYGLHRLLQLQLPDKFRYIGRQVTSRSTLAMQYGLLDSLNALQSDLRSAVALELVDRYGQNVRDADAFSDLIKLARTHAVSVGQELIELARESFEEFHRTRLLLTDDLESRIPSMVHDIESQLGYLIYPGFLTEVPLHQLGHYPRYLQAVQRRIESATLEPAKEHSRMQQVEGFWNDYLERVAELEEYPPSLDQFHWLLEEYRVSLFAQPMKTAEKVSAKRLKQHWKQIPQP